MKKNYVKPHVYFEDFRLSTSIAGGCAWTASFAENSCPVKVPGTTLTYITDINTCYFSVPATNDKFCYHVPMDNKNVFSSI